MPSRWNTLFHAHETLCFTRRNILFHPNETFFSLEGNRTPVSKHAITPLPYLAIFPRLSFGKVNKISDFCSHDNESTISGENASKDVGRLHRAEAPGRSGSGVAPDDRRLRLRPRARSRPAGRRGADVLPAGTVLAVLPRVELRFSSCQNRGTTHGFSSEAGNAGGNASKRPFRGGSGARASGSFPWENEECEGCG